MKIKTNIQNLNNHKIYHKVEQAVHEFLQKKGYLKVDVPVLSPALIPESYLEVFETEFNYFDRREKLYLTPSPELFLKRLLVAGSGNIYYLGKAFRNSEPNSDFHSPEYTMLEYYKVGETYLELTDEILEMMRYISSSLSFRPESRNLLQSPMKEISPLVSLGRNDKNIVYQGNKISFTKWEKYTVAEAFEKFAKISEKELFNPELFMKKAEKKGYKVKGFSYQDVFSQIITQEIEPNLGKNGYPSLLYDYPKEVASLAKLNKDKKTAKRAEFYINGIEIGGCCEELNDWKEQKTRFQKEYLIRKKAKMTDHPIDKGFIKALKYKLPDCSGAGIGFERLAMVFVDVNSIDKLKLINIVET